MSEKSGQRLISKMQLAAAKEAKKFLTVNLDEHITIPQLSRELGVSQTSLKESFKIVHGDSIHNYVRRRRIEKAAYLIRTTDKSILEIAVIVGYTNGSKFSEAFRDIMSCSPSEYRKRQPAKKCPIGA